ncbi:MAG: ferritin-like domain-containing protein [Defluviitaleaceae bacterium]|nr:ferritin-like domain-containing protein [Defluviitaleaceae bacterium]
MPLVFPPAPTAYFKRTNEVQNESQKAEHRNDCGLRLYPLNPERSQKNRRTMPVEPLTRTKMPHMMPPHKVAPLQHLLKQPQSRPPMVPPQFNPPRQMPQFTPPPMVPQMPQFTKPPMIPQTPPEKAAEQFRRMNRTLPDGVRYEPLDDEIMQILRQNNIVKNLQPAAQMPETPPTPPAPPTSPTPPAPSTSQPFSARTPMIPFQPPAPAPSQTLPPETAETLKRLAQDERNAFILYTHFAENEQEEKIKEPFAILAKDSKSRLELYTTLLEQDFKENFIPQEAEINTEIEISDAITLALSAENKGLIALGNLLDLTADTSAEKSLGRVLNRKIIGHQLLLSLKY